jgi:hypothetical protein
MSCLAPPSPLHKAGGRSLYSRKSQACELSQLSPLCKGPGTGKRSKAGEAQQTYPHVLWYFLFLAANSCRPQCQAHLQGAFLPRASLFSSREQYSAASRPASSLPARWKSCSTRKISFFSGPLQNKDLGWGYIWKGKPWGTGLSVLPLWTFLLCDLKKSSHCLWARAFSSVRMIAQLMKRISKFCPISYVDRCCVRVRK